jgi:hypothetical protein
MHFCGVAASRSLPSPLVGQGAGAERPRVRGRAASSELVGRPLNPRYRAPLLPRGEKGLCKRHGRASATRRNELFG